MLVTERGSECGWLFSRTKCTSVFHASVLPFSFPTRCICDEGYMRVDCIAGHVLFLEKFEPASLIEPLPSRLIYDSESDYVVVTDGSAAEPHPLPAFPYDFGGSWYLTARRSQEWDVTWTIPLENNQPSVQVRLWAAADPADDELPFPPEPQVCHRHMRYCFLESIEKCTRA